MNEVLYIPFSDVDRRPSPKGNGHAKSVSFRSMRELGAIEFPPIKYVVPGYIVEGCTLLAGRPKLGKSWLMLDVALTIARGGYCLGNLKCETGDVLYLALEDNERRLQSRVKKITPGGCDDPWPDTLEYATTFPRADQGGVDMIRSWINSKPNPRLVVVDVLTMFRGTCGDRETLYESDYRALKGLQQLAGETGVGIVVVHHTRKGTGDVDPFEKISGTLGLSGAADSSLILDRDSNGCTLYGRGRDIAEIENAIEFNRDTCRWRILGEASEVRCTDERGAILALLEEADETLSPADVADALGYQRNNTKQLLFKMAKAGEVRKVSRGRYIYPTRTDLVTDETSTPDNHDNR